MKVRHSIHLTAVAAIGLLAWPSAQVFAVSINFDDPGLTHGSDVTTFYSGLGVIFNGISNPFPSGPGPYPAPSTVPTTLGGASVWDPGTAPGESAPNFAVGEGEGNPGSAGILMSFSTLISSLTVTGLDFGNGNDFGNGFDDKEEMTLSAYGVDGNLLGQEHFTTQIAIGAIRGTIAFAGMKYVAFNYSNTEFGFCGIDDLEFDSEQNVPEAGATAVLLGLIVLGFIGTKWRKVELDFAGAN